MSEKQSEKKEVEHPKFIKVCNTGKKPIPLDDASKEYLQVNRNVVLSYKAGKKLLAKFKDLKEVK